MVPRHSASWDWMGQLLSGLCIAHCLALPLVLSFLPAVAAELLEGEAVHRALILGVTGTAAVAFLPGLRLHRRASVLGLAAVALGLLASAAFLLPEGGGEGIEAAEVGLTLGGGALMAAAHWWNRTLCRSCCEVRTEAP
jgi:hypothetical protein